MIYAVGLALLGLTLYMSTLAYALRDYSRSRLAERLGQNGRRKRWLEWLENNESQLQALAAFVRLVLIVGLLICTYVWYVQVFAPERVDVLALAAPALISLLLLLVFSVGIPHALALHASDSVVARSLPALKVLKMVLYPIGWSLTGLEFITRRLLGKPDDEEEENEWLEQEVLDVVSEGEAQGAVDEDQKEIIKAVFQLADTAVSEIMTPRTDFDAIQAETTFDEVRELILRSGHSRIPVYEQSVDHIIGVLYAKDLLRLNPGDAFDARRLMRIAPYVPESKSVMDLMDDFRQTKVQIAIVLDEYGGTAGLVTIEDILEELVGEIDDEYDQQPAPTILRIDDNTLEVDARVHVDEINEELKINLPDEDDYDTIGGFVFATLGKIPAVGEAIRHENVSVSVLAAEPRKITRVRVRVERDGEGD